MNRTDEHINRNRLVALDKLQKSNDIFNQLKAVKWQEVDPTTNHIRTSEPVDIDRRTLIPGLAREYGEGVQMDSICLPAGQDSESELWQDDSGSLHIKGALASWLKKEHGLRVKKSSGMAKGEVK